MIKLIRSLCLLSTLVAFAAVVEAQPAPKVFVIDLAKLYDGHYETEEQNAKLKVDEKKAQEQLEQLNGEGNALVKQFQELQEQANNPALTSDAKTKNQAEVQKKSEEIQRKQNEVRGFSDNTKRMLQQRIVNFRQVLLEKINKLATEIAKKKGATLLIDKSGPTMIGVSSLIYFDPAYDLTEEVAKEINKDRPATSTAPAATTETKAPATTPAAKPAEAAPATNSLYPGASTKK